MIGILIKFLEYMKLEADKINLENSQNFKPLAKQKSESSEMIEIDESENVYSEQSEVITKFENGKEVKIEVITQTIPVSKTSALRKVTTERIR